MDGLEAFTQLVSFCYPFFSYIGLYHESATWNQSRRFVAGIFCSKHLVDLDIIYMSTYMYWVIRFHEKSPGPWNFAKFCSFLNAISVLFINYLYTNAIWMIERLISTTPPPMDEIFWSGVGSLKVIYSGVAMLVPFDLWNNYCWGLWEKNPLFFWRGSGNIWILWRYNYIISIISCIQQRHM